MTSCALALRCGQTVLRHRFGCRGLSAGSLLLGRCVLNHLLVSVCECWDDLFTAAKLDIFACAAAGVQSQRADLQQERVPAGV